MFDAEAELAQELLELAGSGSEAGGEADVCAPGPAATVGSPECLVAPRASSFVELRAALQLRSARFQALAKLHSSDSAVGGPHSGLQAWPRGSSGFPALGSVQGGAGSAVPAAAPGCPPLQRPCQAPQPVDLAPALQRAGEHAEQSRQVPSAGACSAAEQQPEAGQAPARPHTPDLASERHGCSQPCGAGRSSPAAYAHAPRLCSGSAPAVSTAACHRSTEVLAAVRAQQNTPPAACSARGAEQRTSKATFDVIGTGALERGSAPDASLAGQSEYVGGRSSAVAAVLASKRKEAYERSKQCCSEGGCDVHCAAAAAHVSCPPQPPAWGGVAAALVPADSEARAQHDTMAMDAWQDRAAAAGVQNDAEAVSQAGPQASAAPVALCHAEATADAERRAAAAAEVTRLAAAAAAAEVARERSAAALAALRAAHAARRRAAGAQPVSDGKRNFPTMLRHAAHRSLVSLVGMSAARRRWQRYRPSMQRAAELRALKVHRCKASQLQRAADALCSQQWSPASCAPCSHCM